MTSKFDSDEQVTQHVIAQLDEANAALSDDVLDELRQRRQQALRDARAQVAGHSRFKGWQGAVVLPAAAVAVFAFLRYDTGEVIPALPSAALLAEVPAEDLALLEDLEFASWLAEQENEVAL